MFESFKYIIFRIDAERMFTAEVKLVLRLFSIQIQKSLLLKYCLCPKQRLLCKNVSLN